MLCRLLLCSHGLFLCGLRFGGLIGLNVVAQGFLALDPACDASDESVLPDFLRVEHAAGDPACVDAVSAQQIVCQGPRASLRHSFANLAHRAQNDMRADALGGFRGGQGRAEDGGHAVVDKGAGALTGCARYDAHDGADGGLPADVVPVDVVPALVLVLIDHAVGGAAGSSDHASGDDGREGRASCQNGDRRACGDRRDRDAYAHVLGLLGPFFGFLFGTIRLLLLRGEQAVVHVFVLGRRTVKEVPHLPVRFEGGSVHEPQPVFQGFHGGAQAIQIVKGQGSPLTDGFDAAAALSDQREPEVPDGVFGRSELAPGVLHRGDGGVQRACLNSVRTHLLSAVLFFQTLSVSQSSASVGGMRRFLQR